MLQKKLMINGIWASPITQAAIEIGGIERERDTGQAADAEHREERGREKHGGVETNGAAPERNEKRAQDDDRRDGDDHRGGLEKGADHRSHPGEPHVVGPDDEGKK